MTDFLQLRHRMLPYLYTENAKAALEGTPLVQPMYWDWPNREEAYRVPNQYLFGSEMIVVPITSPQDPKLKLARVRGWLPPGRYVDIFNGIVYEGDRELWISRPLKAYPVLAKEGAIIPLDAAHVPANGGDNPEAFEILIVVGADGEYEIMEDDGTGSMVKNWTRTAITYTQKTGVVEIGPLPVKRDISLRFVALKAPSTIKVLIDGAEKKVTPEVVSNGLLIDLGSVNEKATVDLGGVPQLEQQDVSAMIRPILADAQIDYDLKEEIWKIVTSKVQVVSRLVALDMDESLRDAVLEYIL